MKLRKFMYTFVALSYFTISGFMPPQNKTYQVDLNNDGLADQLHHRYWGCFPGIFANLNTGEKNNLGLPKYGLETTIYQASNVIKVHTQDVDHDGLVDIVFTTNGFMHGPYVLLNEGDGKFSKDKKHLADFYIKKVDKK